MAAMRANPSADAGENATRSAQSGLDGGGADCAARLLPRQSETAQFSRQLFALGRGLLRMGQGIGFVCWLGRRLRCIKDEPWHVRSARKLDAHRVIFVGLKVILRQLLANFSSFYADHGVISRVVADRAAEHLSPDHPLSQAIDVAFQGMVNDQVEKILGTFASRERVT